MQVIFTQAARAELLEAQDWYEAQQTGLGARFRKEVETAVECVQHNPDQFPVVFRDAHRALLRRFPYGLFFEIETDLVIIFACFHCSRGPRSWQWRV